MSLARFFVLYTLFTLGLGLLMHALYAYDLIRLMPKFWVIFGTIAILTFMAYMFSWIGIRKGGEFSVLAILGGILLKLIFCMVLVLFYLQKFKVNDLVFAGNFISLYFLFTAFEVYALLCNLRHQNKHLENTH